MAHVANHGSESPSQRGARVGEKIRDLRRIRLVNPRQHELIENMEQLRVSALDRLPGEATWALRVIQPSGAGKSECAKQMTRFVESQAGREPGMTPVLHVTLDTTGTPRSMIVSCLEAIGDPFAQTGTEALLLKRLKKAIARNGVELLIIDELNHCSEKVLGRDVSNTLKNMLTNGWVPIVFLGTEKANRLFKDNRELRNRCQAQLSLAPLDYDSPADRELWEAFLAGLDEQIVKQRILPGISNLAATDVAQALCTACDGLIGELRLVLEDAIAMVLRRRGRRIDLEDLHAAVQVRYVNDGDLASNPFDTLAAR